MLQCLKLLSESRADRASPEIGATGEDASSVILLFLRFTTSARCQMNASLTVQWFDLKLVFLMPPPDDDKDSPSII